MLFMGQLQWNTPSALAAVWALVLLAAGGGLLLTRCHQGLLLLNRM